MSSPPSAHAGRVERPAAATAPHRSSSDGRGSPAPWRRRGLRLQPAPHCRLPSAAAFLQKYELGAQLGRGNFGTVWEARERATGRTWAAKVVAKSSNRMKMLLLTREIQVLKMVEHPNIVYLREILETAENVYLILELCEHGELAKFWKHKGKISEKDARTIISGISNAIQYLHKHGIVHRDLKLENVLLASPRSDSADPDSSSGQPCAKLSDFGLAEVKDKRDHDHMMELFCGTPYCMAPEILSERAYSQQCDVWSMGVILYSLITGSSPYMGGSERDVLYSIHRHPHLQDDPALTTVTEGARDLLTRMLHLDPAYRITAAEVVAHPWITDKCTQASASQDILTLMKEWRTEEADRTDTSSPRRTVDLTPPGQTAGTQTTETERPPVETPRTTAGNSSTRSSSSAGGQSSSAGGQSASGSGRGASGGAAQRGRGGGSARGSRRTGKLSSSGSDPTVRPSSGASGIGGSGGGCVRRSCPAAVSTTALGGGRPWSGPRVTTPTVPARRPTPPVTGVTRRSSAAGVPPRPGAATPHTPERPDTPQLRTGGRRTTGPTPPPTATERARLT